jgi:hypothetical protein
MTMKNVVRRVRKLMSLESLISRLSVAIHGLCNPVADPSRRQDAPRPRATLSATARLHAAARGYSSVGKATSCEPRRRPETRRERQERRVRPHCRRVGNKTATVGRLVVARASALFNEKSPPSGLGRRALKGLSSPQPTQGLDAGVSRGVDTSEPMLAAAAGAPPGPPPAATRRSAAPIGEQPCNERWGREAERLFEQAFGPPQGGPLVDPEPLLIELRRFERFAAKVAAGNGWAPREDRALSMLGRLIEEEAEHRREEGLPPVRHLGWFVARMRRAARREEELDRARRRQGSPEERAALGRRLAGVLAVELVERLRDPDPARGGYGPRPQPRGGSNARCT